MTWYTHSRREQYINGQLVTAGMLFQCAKVAGGDVHICQVECHTPVELICSADTARSAFIAPCRDFNAVLESAVLCCEAAYC
jgi:hypothetical protein